MLILISQEIPTRVKYHFYPNFAIEISVIRVLVRKAKTKNFLRLRKVVFACQYSFSNDTLLNIPP